MKKLTNKEREVMELFWQYGDMFVRELLEHYEEPRPHFNTLSTIVRRLEQQGYLGHKQYGTTYQYHALISEQDYAKNNIFRLVDDYIKDSYKGLVSAFLKEEKLSVDELGTFLFVQIAEATDEIEEKASQSKTETITARGKTYEIKVSYDETAELPDDAELKVEKLSADEPRLRVIDAPPKKRPRRWGRDER